MAPLASRAGGGLDGEAGFSGGCAAEFSAALAGTDGGAVMPERDQILHRVRTALGRRVDDPPEAPPELLLEPPRMTLAERVNVLLTNFPGEARHVKSLYDARERVLRIIDGAGAVASNALILAEAGITALKGVASGFQDEAALRSACASAPFGITGASYALADPPALVMLASNSEARMVSLLPPVHIALIRAEQILSGLDELFLTVPDPSVVASSMVLIGGPSRTGDIEMTLTLGVHGPRELHLIIV
jgi:L-lactate dehydrogenase complex protein LldG